MDTVTRIKLLKSERSFYEYALRRNMHIEGGSLTAHDREFYARGIAVVSRRLAAVLGAMPW